MMMHIDIAWKSLNKYGEELCGDKVEIIHAPDSDILVLSDGLGSGVKANILASLTSKIIITMLNEGLSVDEAVDTIAHTLPICKVRQIAYSTFTILQLFHDGRAYLVEFDNPACIFIRNGKLMEVPYELREIAGKTVRESKFDVNLGDMFALVSDGVVFAGVGAILNLGVDRSVVGDILIKDKEAWVFCLHKMSDFFIDNLVRVRHTTVLVTRVEQAEEIPEPQFEAISGTCASVRLDSLIGLAFQTSRSSMVSFIESGLVFVNGKLITSNGYEPKEGDIISVRGKGRFIYDGVSRQTKKGRLGVRLRKYI